VIPFFVPEFSKEMEEVAIHSLRNEKFVMGESVFKFEEEFANYIGTKYAISVSSGNSALHLSLLSLGINQKSKVLTSTNSFVASANCILMTGAIPILSDIDPKDGNIEITESPPNCNCIIPVHLYGNPCNYDSIKQYSEEMKIPVVEDACQAHGAIYKNKKVGSLGTLGCFSFYPTKNMTVCGDGGMVTTDDEELANTIISLRDNGRKTRTEHDKLGYTMRLNTISAAIGRVQLKNLDKNNARRREIASLYKKELPEENFLQENPNGESVFHQIIFKNKNREKIIEHLSENEIGFAIHYPIPIHKQPLYLSYGFSLPKSESFCNKVISLPSYPQISDDQIHIICEVLNKVI